MSLKHDDGWNIPPDAPFYPPLPAVYRGVKFHFLFFTARPQAIAQLLPEPLEPDPDGNCVAAGIDIPFCTSYGAFQEVFLALKCKFRGQFGYYCSHILHNGPAGIAAGREIYGSPKIFATLDSNEGANLHDQHGIRGRRGNDQAGYGDRSGRIAGRNAFSDTCLETENHSARPRPRSG